MRWGLSWTRRAVREWRGMRAPGRVATVVLAGCGAFLALAPAGVTRPSEKLATFTVDRSKPGHPVHRYQWTVPLGVKRVRFEVFGASGGDQGGWSGGLGGYAEASFAVRSGQVFEIVVGGEGAAYGAYRSELRAPGGLNGGGRGSGESGAGGGGASDVRAGNCTAKGCGFDARFIVAGGGGGASADFGGVGGGEFGGRPGHEVGATGGEPTRGGRGINEGTFGTGGDGGGDLGSGDDGGGGGGWFGGGGRAPSTGSRQASGGGGGSGHISGLALSGRMASGVHAGDGLVVIYKE